MVNRNTNNLVEVRKNLKHGKGLFALKDLKQGEKVYSFKKGKVIGPDQIKKLSETEKRYLDKISVDEYEIIKPPGCYVNHSCDPNVEEKNMTKLLSSLPSLKRPTISPLSEKGWYGVNTIIPKSEFHKMIPKLRKIAQGLVVHEPRQILELEEIKRHEEN